MAVRKTVRLTTRMVDELVTRAQRAEAYEQARTEHGEQCAVIEWAQLNEERLPALKMLWANPNGGARHIAVALKLKAEGVKRGVPDLQVAFPINGYHGLFIEMKMPGNDVTPEQEKMIADLRALGYRAEVCYSADDAIQLLEEYASGKLKLPMLWDDDLMGGEEAHLDDPPRNE